MTLTFDAIRWSQDQDGYWLHLRATEKGLARAFLEAFKVGKQYIADLKEKRNKRSLDANAYCWVLLDKLAEATGEPKSSVYRSYVKEVGGNSETVCVLEKAARKLRDGWEHNGIGWVTEANASKIDGCVNVTLYYGSSTYDTRQMSRLIDLIVDDCKEQGIETKTPQELASMLDRWGDG